MGVILHNGEHHAPGAHHARDKGDDRRLAAFVAHDARGKDKIADVRARQGEIRRHVQAEPAQMLPDDGVHGVGNLAKQQVFSAHEPRQFRLEAPWRLVLGQPVGEQGVNFGVAEPLLIGESHNARAQIADGGYVEGPAQGSRTAARVKGRDKMNGVGGVGGQFRRCQSQRAPAAEKEHFRPHAGEERGVEQRGAPRRTGILDHGARVARPEILVQIGGPVIPPEETFRARIVQTALVIAAELGYRRIMSMNHETVAVALSGGADSLYSLISLRENGRDVFGLHGIFLTPESEEEEAAAAAMRERLAVSCARLGVALHVVDLRAEFTRLVVRPFVEDYARGLTPNPCARCNASIKFGLLQDAALRLGANRLATGHYAALSFGGEGGIASGASLPALFQGEDAAKDQSYFLGLVPLGRLNLALFPLETARKTQVLESLRRRGISPPQPGESQEVCFIPGDEYRNFVPRMAELFGIPLPGPGPMLLADSGRDVRLGTHQGLWRYTEGQRKGLGVGWREPLYVIGKERDDGALRLGPREALCASGCECDEVNYLLPFDDWPISVLVKTRYRERPKAAMAEPLPGGGLRIRFARADSAVAAGQIAAVYVPDRAAAMPGALSPEGRLRLVAGGVIARGL